MTTTETIQARVEKTIKAPLAKVRAALTDPEMVCQWFSPGQMTCEVPAMDAKVGGQYEIVMVGQGPDGNEFRHAMTGSFTELTDTRVAMTMTAPDRSGVPMETVTTYDLSETDDGTHLVLTQAGFAVQEMADGASMGWKNAVENLATLLEA